uniref:Uncharacterized protein n=1 Tax=Salmonella phage PMBT31 TaxID=3153514 RepID=A0AAU8GLI1_9CAUD
MPLHHVQRRTKFNETGARIPQNRANRQVIFSFIFALPYLTKSKILVVRFSRCTSYDCLSFPLMRLESLTERFRPC